MTSQWEVLACTSAEWADLMVYGYEIRVCWSERLFSQENRGCHESPLSTDLCHFVCVVAQCAATHGERTVWILGEQLYAWVLLPLV